MDPAGPDQTAPSSLPGELEQSFLQAIDQGESPESILARLRGQWPQHAVALERLAAQLQDRNVSSEPAVDSLLGELQSIGPYRVLERLGRGGFGTVYAAERREPVYQKVAVKVINPGMDTREVLARFEAERHALSLMNHPGIARVLDAGATELGRPYFVMEYVSGFPITDFCDRRKLDVRQRLLLMIQVCEAVQHAHQKGIIHRDLSARNILVTEVDGKPQPKIIDFGVAKSLVHRLTGMTLHTAQSQVFGTPEYMSPEQAQSSGHDIDTRTDVYALGVVLYQLLTGTLPIPPVKVRNVGPEERAQVLRTFEPARPSLVVQRVPEKRNPGQSTTTATAQALRGDLDWITLKALAKDRDLRYATVLDLAADLRRHLNDETVQAGPPSTMLRMRKFVRRFRVQVAAAGIVLLSLVVTLGVVWAAWQQTRVAEARARKAEAAIAAVAKDQEQRLQSYGQVLHQADVGPVGALARDLAVIENLQRNVPGPGAAGEPAEAAALVRWLNSTKGVLRQAPVHEAALGRALAGAAPQSVRRLLLDDLRVRLDGAVQAVTPVVTATEAECDRRLREATDQDLWRRVCADIRRSDGPYAGLEIAPQPGLVPLGRDPVSGLHQFALWSTGAPPKRSSEYLAMDQDTAVVLVLIPGGEFTMGATPEREAPNSDPLAQPIEGPPHRVKVAPFLLAKCELNQTQWVRLSGQPNPSNYQPADVAKDTALRFLLPVEMVSWEESSRVLRWFGMRLPTEAEWEYACRAGTDTPWWTGPTRESLAGDPAAANLADRSAARFGWADVADWPEFEDGFDMSAPVHWLLPNRFGLLHMLGNVDEWCEDLLAPYPGSNAGRSQASEQGRAVRGGSFRRSYKDARASRRTSCGATDRLYNVGVRPAMSLRGG